MLNALRSFLSGSVRPLAVLPVEFTRTLYAGRSVDRFLHKLEQGNVASEMTIGLKGENLLDNDMRNHVSFRGKDETYQPGRAIRLYGGQAQLSEQ